MPSRPLRTFASVTSTLALVAAGFAATTGAAQADPDVIEQPVDTDLCPGTPVWTGGFTSADVGKPVTGKTTTHGITPEGFTGEYVSTLRSAAGRGKDIYLFRMEGSRITKTNAAGDEIVDAGIWAGMSGSPVYDGDGNLIGSVSYGFSGGASNLAGVTPAKDLISIQDGTGTTAAVQSAPVSASVSRLAAQSTTTSSDTAADFSEIHQLALPRVSAGIKGADATSIASKSRTLAKKYGSAMPKFHTGSQYDGTLDAEAAIVAGGNIATSWSHGDVALAAVGTVTAVCGDKVFAFGHPDNFDGDKATETFHAAEAAAIQEDATFGSYKLANIDMKPLGQITQDRLSGIMGVLGQLPVETTITTNTTLGSATTSAETKVSVPAAVSAAVGSQLFNDALDGLDAYVNGGEALMTWTINYTPRGGVPANYTRTQRVSTNEYFAEEMPYDVASDVEFLQAGSDTKVAINAVTVNTQLFPDHNALRISRIDIRSNGKWVKVKNGTRVNARRGKAFPIQVHLVPANADSVAAPVIKRLDQTISTSASGTGHLSFVGGQNYYDDFEDEFTIDIDEEDEDYYYDEEEPLTLAQVLAALKAQVRNDTARSSQQYVTKYGSDRVSRKSVATPAVTSGSAYIRLRYTS